MERLDRIEDGVSSPTNRTGRIGPSINHCRPQEGVEAGGDFLEFRPLGFRA